MATITGTSGRDTLNGTSGDDVIYSQGDNDRVNGNGGNDEIGGGSGNDVLNGDGGNDTIYGGDGNDRLNGGNQSDLLFGGAGRDTMDGGGGNDLLLGGGGNDNLKGGGGADTFEFYNSHGNDTITDFSFTGGDSINLGGSINSVTITPGTTLLGFDPFSSDDDISKDVLIETGQGSILIETDWYNTITFPLMLDAVEAAIDFI